MDLYLPCRQCRARAYLIRGLCAKCAPELHRNRWELYNAYAALAERYEAETGKRAIADCDAFDEWCIQELNPTPPGPGEG